MLIIGSVMVLGGAALAVWSAAFAKFNRDQVSRLLPQKRYWWVWSDAGRVRFFGIVAVVFGILIFALFFQQLLTGGTFFST